MAEGDIIASKLVTGGVDERISKLERDVAALRSAETSIRSLSDLSTDMGLVLAGEMRSGDGEPGDGFTGVRFGFPPFEYIDQEWNIVGVNSDSLMFGLSADDGKAYAAGGALVIDDTGITRDGLNYFDRWNADFGGLERRLEIGSFLNGSTPAGYISFYDPSTGTNLQLEGDFENNTFTGGWTTAASSSGVWSIGTTTPYEGTYYGNLLTDGAIESDLVTNGGFETNDFTGWTTGGTGSWTVITNTSIVPNDGTRLGFLTAGNSQTGTLTSATRMAVTAGLVYGYHIAVGGSFNANFSTQQLLIKWWTASSGGSLVQTDTITLQIEDRGSFVMTQYSGLKTAPATATHAELVVNLARTASGGSLTYLVDLLMFGEAQYGTLTTDIGTPDRMAVTAGNTYQFNFNTKQDVAVASLYGSAVCYVNYYDATSGGNFVSSVTVPVTIGTSGYNNQAIALTAPAGAVGAELQYAFYRQLGSTVTTYAYNSSSVNLLIDDVQYYLLTVTRAVQFLPNFTVVDGPLDLKELSASPDTPSSGRISIYADTSDYLRVKNDAGSDREVGFGWAYPRITYSNSAAKTTIFTKSIAGNTLGANGMLEVFIPFLYQNNSGVGVAMTVTTDFGSSSTTIVTNNHAASAAYITGFIRVTLNNENSASAQLVGMEIWYSSGAVLGSTAQVNQHRFASQRFTESTAVAKTLTISMTLAVGTSTQVFATGGARMTGPFYMA